MIFSLRSSIDENYACPTFHILALISEVLLFLGRHILFDFGIDPNATWHFQKPYYIHSNDDLAYSLFHRFCDRLYIPQRGFLWNILYHIPQCVQNR